ncbi:MAG: DUF5711 family protein [Lachnospiraceae bacterium]|nr:DUF5711 family protein [Lachnospiraceae bacterium]
MADFKVIDGGAGGEENYDQKVLIHRIVSWVARFMLAAIAVCVVYFGYKYYQDYVYNEYTIESRTLRSDSDTAKYLGFNGHILKYSNDGAEAFNGDGTALWNMTYQMTNPLVATCEDYVAIGESNVAKIIVMDPAGVQNTIDTKLPVQNFRVASQGVVAALLEDGDNMLIELYDKTGTELARLKCSMAESGYPLDMALSPNGKLLGISYLRIDDNKLKTSLAFYNFGEVGENEIDNLVSGYDYDERVFPRIRFLDDEHAVAIGDERVIFFKGAERPVKNHEYRIKYDVKSLFFGDGMFALSFKLNTRHNSDMVDVFNAEGKKVLSQRFEMDYTDVLLANNQMVVYNDSNCLIYNMKGHCKFSGKFQDKTLLMVASSSPTVFSLVSRSVCELIRFH